MLNHFRLRCLTRATLYLSSKTVAHQRYLLRSSTRAKDVQALQMASHKPLNFPGRHLAGG
jgi:hypothetical protein